MIDLNRLGPNPSLEQIDACIQYAEMELNLCQETLMLLRRLRESTHNLSQLKQRVAAAASVPGTPHG